MKICTRIAPSPTGFAHIGTIYQVLFDYGYAKKHDGRFIVRIEDTDRARFVDGAEDVVLDAIEWFGLSPDESPRKDGGFGPYRQSERLEMYRKYAEELVEKGHAFYCFCSRERLEEMRASQEASKQAPRYDGLCCTLSEVEVKKKLAENAQHVIRMKIPELETIVVHDELLGDVSFESNTIDMQVILKGDGFPTYHLGVVVDDYLMQVTHIFRGREWLPSTPKHVLLYRYFGWEAPKFIHLPVILNSEGRGKLSKRQGHASVQYYIDQGYLPEAILNYLSLIVWKHPEGKEVYGLDEFVRLFEIKDVTSQGPKFDIAKLNWLNGVWIRGMDDEVIIDRLRNGYTNCSVDKVRRYLPLVKDRLVTLSDFDDLVLFFIKGNVLDVVKSDYPKKHEGKDIDDAYALDVLRTMMRGKNLQDQNVNKILEFVGERVAEEEVMDTGRIEHVLKEWFSTQGFKNADAFMVIRVALTGRTATPPLTQVMDVLGKEMVLVRLRT